MSADVRIRGRVKLIELQLEVSQADSQRNPHVDHHAPGTPPTVMAPSSMFLSADRLRRMGRASRNYTIGWAMH